MSVLQQRSGLAALLVGSLALGACTSTPEPPPKPDPRVELARHNDEFWSYLSTTYDRDANGQVARDEYARGEESFARLDRDRDGVLTRADLDRELVLPGELVGPILLVRLAGGPDAKSASTSDVAAKLKSMDSSGDGRVDRDEYARASPPFMPGHDAFGTLLGALDGDRDGLLSGPEIDHWLTRRDVDGDGSLTLRERSTTGPAPREGFIEFADRQPAPDFVATAMETLQPTSLASKFGPRPIALIFGSFT